VGIYFILTHNDRYNDEKTKQIKENLHHWRHMNLKSSLREFLENMTGYSFHKRQTTAEGFYNEDGLWTIHNHEFMADESFIGAYQRGCDAADDYKWHWRVHIGLWAAYSASLLDGDFIECGVNRGFLSSAIMEYLNWNSLNKTFFLLDTFSGLDEYYLSHEEVESGILERNQNFLKTGFYTQIFDDVRKNFLEWKNVQFIQGSIPKTLPQVKTGEIAFLHLDLNNVIPEVEAMNFFWDRLVPGAIILSDDYSNRIFRPQKIGLDAVAQQKGVKFASLPTGQGLVIKPPK